MSPTPVTSPSSGPDPALVHTPAELAQALNTLRRARGFPRYEDVTKAAAQKGQALEKGTLSPMLSKGHCSDDKLILFLDVCQVPRKDWQDWRDALARVRAEHQPGIPGAVRVSAMHVGNLHIHRAIEVDGLKGRLPAYVERDTDTAPGGVRELLRRVKDGGGMVVLVGGSSVGKTRCAFEAIRAVMPEWWMIIPDDGAHLRELAGQPLANTVIWLDELQNYLDGERGLSPGMVRAFNACGAVLVATLWPTYYTSYTALPTPDGADPYRVERQVLELAQPPVHIEPSLSRDELKRAHQIAQDDRRITVALEVTGYGMTQALAGVPQLIERWKHADAYTKAILCAAVDATRLGVRSPLSSQLLRAAATGYCTPRQKAEAQHTPNWFEAGLADATQLLHGAVCALEPVAVEMGQIDGYLVTDYLRQHAAAERRMEKVPSSTWNALVRYLADPDDQVRAAHSAMDRLLYRYAESLYRTATDTDTPYAAEGLAKLLAKRGHLDYAITVLRERTDASNLSAASHLAELLAERGDLDGLRERANAGDLSAASHLAELLTERGDLDGLRERANAGDPAAASRLAGLLAERGDVDGLRERADAYNLIAVMLLARLLAKRGDLDGLRERADAGDRFAASHLAELLAKRGDLDGLRERADAGDLLAADRLGELLAKRGDLDGLRERADAGDLLAAVRLGELLAERSDLDDAITVLRERADAYVLAVAITVLCILADAGDLFAADRLAGLLAKRGDLGLLRERADAGDRFAARHLAELLAKRGDLDGLRECADAGRPFAASHLAGLLAKRGDLDGLRERADAGDLSAARHLAELLAKRGDLDGLRERVDAGGPFAAQQLMELLERIDPEEADYVRRSGLPLNR